MSPRLVYLLVPFKYLLLVDEKGAPLWHRDIVPTLALATVIVVPFAVFGGNFLAPQGFLDRLGSFLAVLTGFYVAALIAVATFASHSGLDKPIEVGPVVLKERDGTEEVTITLTRREYTTAMFGFLSLSSLLITLVGIFVVPIATPIRATVDTIAPWLNNSVGTTIGLIAKLSLSIIIAHLLITTYRGLYYMMDQMYAKSPSIVKKPRQPRVRNTKP